VLPQTSVGIFPEKMPIARLWVTLQKSEKCFIESLIERYAAAGMSLLLVEVDGFVLVARDAGANLRGRPSCLSFEIGVEAFGCADGALGAVDRLIATVQAGVAQGTIAAAIARQLVNDAGDLGRELIGPHLPVVTEVGAGQLLARKDRWDRVNIERRRGVIGGNVVGRVGPLRITGRSEGENG